ncbi:unnamed protein product [Lactuca saligna]|uniref:Uncharacterized protein n=1 Tax=Lactuca saligna TaxID=75948 RepID=A0AA35ZVB1_LACSI|nr:unnamed protein product [Lactuca saligna]
MNSTLTMILFISSLYAPKKSPRSFTTYGLHKETTKAVVVSSPPYSSVTGQPVDFRQPPLRLQIEQRRRTILITCPFGFEIESVRRIKKDKIGIPIGVGITSGIDFQFLTFGGFKVQRLYSRLL